jgi:hypothetical protein
MSQSETPLQDALHGEDLDGDTLATLLGPEGERRLGRAASAICELAGGMGRTKVLELAMAIMDDLVKQVAHTRTWLREEAKK